MSFEFPPLVLFRTVVRCRYREHAPVVDGRLGDWTDDYLLPPLQELADSNDFARLWMGWNHTGLYLAVHAPREQPLVGNRQQPASADALELFLDTRAGQTGHRATQFCYHFWVLPTGGGADRHQPLIWQEHIRRALRRAPLCDERLLQVAAHWDGESYGIELGLPAEALPGMELEAGRRLAVAIIIHDLHNGWQSWGTSWEFPYETDPSTWGLVELSADEGR